MSDTFKRLEPVTICDVFRQTGGDADEMLAERGQPTTDCIAQGCRTLAMLWSSAWMEAKAKAPPPNALEQSTLRELYLDPTFAPSLYLPELVTRPPNSNSGAGRSGRR